MRYTDIGIAIDISRMRFDKNFLTHFASKADHAITAMRELEAGAIANPDENRMVGHYWLRDAALAPTPELREEITQTGKEIRAFAREVHEGKITGAHGARITDVLSIGIGGSALGPQLVADALWEKDLPIRLHFFDNTDPDGFEKVLDPLREHLASTLVLVISKSGGTKESRNGMLVAQAAFEKAGIHFAPQFVAITGKDSALDQTAIREHWLRRFPMWDWVGGRTSVMSPVGLVPMALQGLDIDAFLEGAKAMDAKTRSDDVPENAAMLLALMWWVAGDGKGKKDMVILPYKDRLLLFSRYLQQLIMESLGKELDLDGKSVHQGIAVYGNKGSTDQHAYVQQLRDGINNFFVTFLEVRKSSSRPQIKVEKEFTSGDYLQGFLRGTRSALYENQRDSITISIPELNAFTLGALIALYERAVGFYGLLVHINAYHQPGVEAGKKAAEAVLTLQERTLDALKKASLPATAEALALELHADPEEVFHILQHLAANEGIQQHYGRTPAQDTFHA